MCKISSGGWLLPVAFITKTMAALKEKWETKMWNMKRNICSLLINEHNVTKDNKNQDTKYSVLFRVILYPYIHNKHFYSWIWKNKTTEELETHSFQEPANWQWFEFSQLLILWPACLLRCFAVSRGGCYQREQLKPDGPLLSSFKDSRFCSQVALNPKHLLNLETVFQITNFSTLRIEISKATKWLQSVNLIFRK